MKANCDICKTEIEVQLCCSGYMCGCMGLPTEPPVCEKQECWDKWLKDREEKRKKWKEQGQ